jgi:hypothetical protein
MRLALLFKSILLEKPPKLTFFIANHSIIQDTATSIAHFI